MSTPTLRRGLVVAVLAVTVALTLAGLWLRVLVGPVWPSALTDWSLGAALLGLSSATVGAVLTVRVPRNVIGWLFLAQGLMTGVVELAREATFLLLERQPDAVAPLWTAWTFAWIIPLNMTALSLLLLLFPFGTPPSRRWRPVVAGVMTAGVAASVATMFSPYIPDQTPFESLPNPAAVLQGEAGFLAVDITSQAILISLIAAVSALIVRVRRSHGAERQQMKWFLYAAVVAVATFIPGFYVEALFVVATLLALPAVPIAAGVAVLRYRLYDIDRVINRTVVYAIVTGILVVAYLGAVTALRALTDPVTGDSALSVAASTLAAAALFQPVRQRIQRVVDRRFNRARYDAVAATEQLRLRFRDELDLETLKVELLDAVCATMQPAGTTLWLRETKR